MCEMIKWVSMTHDFKLIDEEKEKKKKKKMKQEGRKEEDGEI